MTSVFISYQRQPSAMLATLIAKELRERGIEVYLDTQRMDSAGAFPERLKEGISGSDVFVCLVGSTTFESEWVQEEIKIALEIGKPLIPVFQEGYQQGQLAPTPAVKKLLEYDGILIFDVKNVYIDQSMDVLARMVENTTAQVHAASKAATPATARPNLNLNDLTGHMLGQYQLRALLGVGGMGAVYRAYQPSLNRDVALKVIAPTLAADEGYARRFVREAQTAAALEHPHIVPVHDYGSDQGFNYVVMRLLNGGSLADRIEHQKATKGPLPSLAEVADVLNKLASALDYAHSRGVIHRDIKANNVMFDDHGTPFLVDFGIAKLTSASTSITTPGMTLGTPSYMAPEQWRGESVTAATDQYALGVLAYGMLTGHMPFEASTPFALMHQHLNDAPPPPENWRADVPPGLRAVLSRAMAKEAVDRYPSVRDFAQAFAENLGTGAGQMTGFFTQSLPQKAPPLPLILSAPPQQRATAPTVVQSPPGANAPTGMPATAQPSRPRPIGWIAAAGIILIGVILAATLGTQPGGFLAAAPTATSTPTATDIPTQTPTATPTLTPTLTDTATLTATVTPSATDTPAPTATSTLTATFTMTPAPTETATPAATDTPAFTPVPPTPIPGNVLLLYDDVSFTLHNRAGRVLSLEGVIFRSASGNWNARSWGVSVYISLPDNACLRLRDASSGQRQPPAACGTLYGLQLVGPPAHFWLNTDTFEVVRGGQVIATCRSDEGSCLVYIP